MICILDIIIVGIFISNMFHEYQETYQSSIQGGIRMAMENHLITNLLATYDKKLIKMLKKRRFSYTCTKT